MSRVRTGSAAVAWAMEQVKQGTGGYEGLCLRFTRHCHNVPARDASAKVAWSRTPIAERHGGKQPPPGVPVYWKIGEYDHVAESAGGGWCVSTDILRRGKADRVRISLITERWGAQYLGWTETINGVRVYTPPQEPDELPVVDLSRLRAATREPGKYPRQVRLVEKALAREGLLDDRWVDGRWADSAAKAWKRWERRIGVNTPNPTPDLASLTALARRHKTFTVQK